MKKIVLYLSFLLIIGCMDKTDERGFYIEGKKLDIIKIQKQFMMKVDIQEKGMISMDMISLVIIKIKSSFKEIFISIL